ncbi:TonB-dependent receptor [Rhizorhabdus argentea]|uniref:TonB-dependent receptor n=1 Tax=Rhizorhabdus argentea TaxID=1387174 RepID=UPI0030EC5F7F
MKKAILCASCCVLGLISSGALGAPTAFNVPPQDLSTALKEFALQSGSQVIFLPKSLAGKRTRGVVGTFENDEALSRLLSDGNVRSQRTNGAYIIGMRTAAVRQSAPSAAVDDENTVDTAARDPAASDATQEIIVTAQRRAQRLQDVPISMISQSGADIARANVTNIQDLQKVIPGLNILTTGTTMQPVLRGVQTTIGAAGNDSPVAIYLDGLYRPNQVVNNFELPDIEQIQVLKGPQGTLFGRNSTGGAILITTRKPSLDRFTGTLSQSVGIYTSGGKGTETISKGFVTGPIVRDKIAASLSAVFVTNSGYFRDIISQGAYGRIRAHQITGKILIEPTDSLEITLKAYHVHRNDRAAMPFSPLNNNTLARRLFPSTPLPQTPWEIAFTQPLGPAIIKDHGGSAQISWNLDWATLSSLTGYSKSYEFTPGDIDATAAPVGVTVSSQWDKPFQQEILLTSKPGRFNWIVGAFYFHNISGSATINGAFGAVHTSAIAGFADGTFDVSEHLSIVGGIRYSSERKAQHAAFYPNLRAGFGAGSPLPDNIPLLGDPVRWHAFTPRASIVYKFSRDANIYATYSKGFKSGGYSISALSKFAVDPEQLNSYEIGFKAATRRYTFNLAVFHYDWQNLQVSVIGTRNGSTFTGIANAASAKLTGIDADGTIDVGGGFSIRMGASFLPEAKYARYLGAVVYPINPDRLGGNIASSMDASGFRLIRAPKLTGSAGLDFRTEIGGGDFEASANVTHSSAFNHEVLGRVRQSAYTLVDGQLSWSPSGSGFQFTIWGKNLTNKAYTTGAVPTPVADAVHYAPPRELGGSVSFKF